MRYPLPSDDTVGEVFKFVGTTVLMIGAGFGALVVGALVVSTVVDNQDRDKLFSCVMSETCKNVTIRQGGTYEMLRGGDIEKNCARVVQYPATKQVETIDFNFAGKTPQRAMTVNNLPNYDSTICPAVH